MNLLHFKIFDMKREVRVTFIHTYIHTFVMEKLQGVGIQLSRIKMFDNVLSRNFPLFLYSMNDFPT